MQETIQAGAILIREGTLLPETLRFESESWVPGWRVVKHLDGYGLDRKIREAGWTFFCQAGETKATVYGMDTEKMVHRAIGRILAELKTEKFNSLAIVRVESSSSKRFLGVRHLTVSAQSRHIQKGLVLFAGGSEPSWLPADAKHAASQGLGIESIAKDRGAQAAVLNAESVVS
jgi:hypothetical protein